METKTQELKPTRPVFQLLFTSEQMNLISAFQRLWTHISHWTRAVLLSYVYNLPNLQSIVDKLFSLPLNFNKILVFYYGAENARTFVDLLTAFIMFNMEVMERIRNGDQEQANFYSEAWYQTADQLAFFLSAINIYWDARQWQNLLYQYIQMKVEEVTAEINKDFSRGFELYDSLEELTFYVGSYMARGIIAMNQYQYGLQTNKRNQPS